MSSYLYNVQKARLTSSTQSRSGKRSTIATERVVAFFRIVLQSSCPGYCSSSLAIIVGVTLSPNTPALPSCNSFILHFLPSICQFTLYPCMNPVEYPPPAPLCARLCIDVVIPVIPASLQFAHFPPFLLLLPYFNPFTYPSLNLSSFPS
ncbi:hypothetical protein WR25_04591 [Diploscapter pachys]|uniref:Uncharacterized protein n=1 Tax=Diploscapter pachys TaxID=2018661 RepID=A0A2A2LL21_9BILA|nr:hypothetical protein WR25_04591 [Diploscapter pachys]